MIDLPPTQLAEVRAILARHLPAGCGAWAFGSRVRGCAKPYSDLDLALIGQGPLGIDHIGRVREAFAASTLPIRVDVLDWHSVPESFRKLISDLHEVIVEPLETTDRAEGQE